MPETPTASLTEMAAGIVCGYLEKHRVTPSDLPALITAVYDSLSGLGEQAPAEAPEAPKKLTSAQIRKSITDDFLVSFEDAKPYRMLKRHLNVFGLTPAAYREKWGLPRDYSMTAPSYSAARSAMAKSFGLGVGGRGSGASKKAKAPLGRRVAKAKATMKPSGPV